MLRAQYFLSFPLVKIEGKISKGGMPTVSFIASRIHGVPPAVKCIDLVRTNQKCVCMQFMTGRWDSCIHAPLTCISIHVEVKFRNFNAERWRILGRVMKHVICIKNVGDATACTQISNGGTGPRCLVGCFACVRFQKKHWYLLNFSRLYSAMVS